MKLNADLIFGLLIVAGTILVASLADDTSHYTDVEKPLSEDVYGAIKINPREGRLWAPWSYASASTRGRFNVGGGSGNGPNVAWDSTMNRRNRRSRNRYNRPYYYY